MKFFLYLLIATFFCLALYGIYYSEQTNWIFAIPILLVLLVVAVSRARVQPNNWRPEQHSEIPPISLWTSPVPYLGVVVLVTLVMIILS